MAKISRTTTATQMKKIAARGILEAAVAYLFIICGCSGFQPVIGKTGESANYDYHGDVRTSLLFCVVGM
jgi:hypothetical protein